MLLVFGWRPFYNGLAMRPERIWALLVIGFIFLVLAVTGIFQGSTAWKITFGITALLISVFEIWGIQYLMKINKRRDR